MFLINPDPSFNSLYTVFKKTINFSPLIEMYTWFTVVIKQHQLYTSNVRLPKTEEVWILSEVLVITSFLHALQLMSYKSQF